MKSHLQAATVLAYLLDSKFKLFGFRFGLNGLVGLIPVVGDAFILLLSLYLVWIALEMELPRWKILEMLANIIINFFIGLVPIVGDFADFFHKANLANLKILKDHAKKQAKYGEVIQPIYLASYR